MKLLVLGASSQLGRELTSLLRSQGVEHEALSSEQFDLLRQMEVLKTISRIKPDQIINTTAYTNLERAETDPEAARLCDLYNTQGVSALAEVCDHLDIPLIHHSSSYVFDGTKRAAYKEDDTINPTCRYGMSKWYGERAIRQLLPRHIILRTDWLFSVHRSKLFREHLKACREHQGRTEVMDHRFSPTPAEDAARVLLAIARQVDCEAQVWGTYHYCALQPVSEAQFIEHFVREAARYDEQLARYAEQLEITVVLPEKPYIPNSSLNCQKIMETFGIKQHSRAAALTYVLEDIYQRAHVQPVSAKQQAYAVQALARTWPGEESRPVRKKPGRSRKKASVAEREQVGPEQTPEARKGLEPPARKAAGKKASPSS